MGFRTRAIGWKDTPDYTRLTKTEVDKILALLQGASEGADISNIMVTWPNPDTTITDPKEKWIAWKQSSIAVPTVTAVTSAIQQALMAHTYGNPNYSTWSWSSPDPNSDTETQGYMHISWSLYSMLSSYYNQAPLNTLSYASIHPVTSKAVIDYVSNLDLSGNGGAPGTSIEVDYIYNPSSQNPQAGTAVSQAILQYSEEHPVPVVDKTWSTTSTNAVAQSVIAVQLSSKLNTATFNTHANNTTIHLNSTTSSQLASIIAEWQAGALGGSGGGESSGGSVVVEQSYNPTSTNAMSGYAVAAGIYSHASNGLHFRSTDELNGVVRMWELYSGGHLIPENISELSERVDYVEGLMDYYSGQITSIYSDSSQVPGILTRLQKLESNDNSSTLSSRVSTLETWKSTMSSWQTEAQYSLNDFSGRIESLENKYTTIYNWYSGLLQRVTNLEANGGGGSSGDYDALSKRVTTLETFKTTTQNEFSNFYSKLSDLEHKVNNGSSSQNDLNVVVCSATSVPAVRKPNTLYLVLDV